MSGRTVRDETIAAILPPAAAGRLLPVERWFCVSPTCPVVYYGADGTLIEKGDTSVRVGLKETEDPIPICYCFGFTRADIRREIAHTGACTIPAQIEAGIRAGQCDCVRRNPSGACCLGDARKAVDEALGTRSTARPALDREYGEDVHACCAGTPITRRSGTGT